MAPTSSPREVSPREVARQLAREGRRGGRRLGPHIDRRGACHVAQTQAKCMPVAGGALGAIVHEVVPTMSVTMQHPLENLWRQRRHRLEKVGEVYRQSDERRQAARRAIIGDMERAFDADLAAAARQLGEGEVLETVAAVLGAGSRR